MTVGQSGERVDQPRQEVDADHRQFPRRRRHDERAALRRGAVEDGDSQAPEMRPRRDFLRPDSGGDELRRDHQRMPAMAIADQFGDGGQRRRAFAGPERRDQQRGVALVEESRGALLIAA